MTEDALLTGPLEPTNEWYAIAKIAGIKLCQAYRRQYGCDFISAMPTNLYGPGDNYDPDSSHVAAALQVEGAPGQAGRAAEIEIWGTGAPRREFLHVDDLADALVFLLKRYSDDSHVNVGTGQRHHDPRAGGTPRESRRLAGRGSSTTPRGPTARRGKVMDVSRLTRARLDGEGTNRGRLPWSVRVVRPARRRTFRSRAGSRLGARGGYTAGYRSGFRRCQFQASRHISSMSRAAVQPSSRAARDTSA